MKDSLYKLPFPCITPILVQEISDLLGVSYQFIFPSESMPILASRDGRIVETKFSTVTSFRRWLADPHSLHETNYSLIEHDDGTYAEYVHVKPSVRAGHNVKAGDLIGNLYGGAGGTEPHLHFEVYMKKGLPLPVHFDVIGII